MDSAETAVWVSSSFIVIWPTGPSMSVLEGNDAILMAIFKVCHIGFPDAINFSIFGFLDPENLENQFLIFLVS